MSSAPRLVPTTVSTQVLSEFASDVVIGLSQPGQKELPSKYLYDEVGSALFDVICVLPEYGLSRAGMRTLTRHAGEIVDRLPSPVIVAELGSGSGQKTRLLLEALARKQRVNYYPIDISGSALSRCQQELGQIDRVSIVGFERAYLDGLQEVAARRREGEKIFVLFLGSTIGNFDRPAGDQFLRDVRAILHEGDALLLSTDLEKPVEMLKLAYDDPAGVTAAFAAGTGYDLATGIGTPVAGGLSCPEVDSVGAGLAGSQVTVTGLGPAARGRSPSARPRPRFCLGHRHPGHRGRSRGMPEIGHRLGHQ